MRMLLAAGSLIVVASTAWASPKTVSLSVPTMDCPVCPITVKQALTKVPGVTRAEVSFDKRQATITFDDAKMTAVLESTLTCPKCGHSKTETMPVDACQWFYECEQCRAVLKPRSGDCCV